MKKKGKTILYKLKTIKYKNYTILYVLMLMIIVFSFANPLFASWRNLTNIITQNTYFIIAAIGMSFVMIGGGIDLSVGYQMSLVGVITAVLIVSSSIPVWLAILIGLMIGAILGFLNGLIVTSVNIFPLIATLATAMVFQGASFMISEAKTYRLDHALDFLISDSLLGIPFDIWLTIIIVAIASIVFKKTYFGRYIFATGGNEEASKLSGIKTKMIRISIYALCGFFFAVATMIMMAKANVMTSTFGPGTEFTALTAAIIGGISFKGGEGKIWGLIVGIFILQVLSNGMQLSGLGAYVQYVVKGAILLFAVIFDEYQKSKRSKPKIEKTLTQE
ncbi:ABC transporter permease [Mariniplasma anaerobium]|uniref:Sugar ABC transporter permease n=1 Tax=Mariniplasma anaerobium TaxID=2735436 RepID=A0A7U9TL02_9MOLU|nr:ABC transporter permease [Mariniplasma anaerobium]BCR36719.1 sugar ABC transporter permease [Mariniplasma anaerobium]